MKIAYPLFVAAATLLAHTSFSQPPESPFAKGKWEYQLMQNFGYNFYNYGHTDDGLDVNYSSDGVFTYKQAGDINTNWMVYGGAEYGIDLNPSMDLYLGADIGVGEGITKYVAGETTTNGAKTRSASTQFGYRLKAGLPFRLFQSSPVYLTPEISYNYLHVPIGGGREVYNNFNFGLTLQTYMGCNDYKSFGHSPSSSAALYRPGRSFIDFTTDAGLTFGKEKIIFQSPSTAGGSETYSDNNLDISYGYYLFPFIAVGAGVTIGGNTVNAPNISGAKTTSESWKLGPVLEFHLPVENAWNNTFLNLNLGLGREHNSETFYGEPAGSKSSYSAYDDNLFSLDAVIGYNMFISKRLALTPKIGYQWASTDTYKQTGPLAQLGIRPFL
jgi:Autotransporter beta-domain